MVQVTEEQARQEFSKLIEDVLHGEDILIVRENQPIARISGIADERPRPRFGSAAGLIEVPNDFDAPLEDFKDYM